MFNILLIIILIILLYIYISMEMKGGFNLYEKDESVINYNLKLSEICKQCDVLDENKAKEEKANEIEKKELLSLLKLQNDQAAEIYLNSTDDLSDIDYLYDLDDNICDEDKLTIKMLDNGEMSKKSIDARNRWTKNNIESLLVREMEMQENRHWWGNQDLEQEFIKHTI